MPKTKTSPPRTPAPNTTDMVRTYLHEIGRVPLLSHEQEIVLGKQVQKMMAVLEVQDKWIETHSKSPTEAELATASRQTLEQLRRILIEGKRAKRKMIEANLRLVVSVAKKYQKRNLELLDLIQEGTLGLERGVEKFDPTRGYKFSTYAYWWIRQAITRAIAQQSRTIRLPIHITEKLNKIKKAQRELSQRLGRSATPAEIAVELEIEPAQIREYLTMARQPISLDLRVGDNQDTELQDLLEDDGQSPEQFTARESLKADVNQLLGELTPQQRQILTLRFGLDNGKELSLAKVGQHLSLSRERVRQLERQALDYLRRRKVDFKAYLAS